MIKKFRYTALVVALVFMLSFSGCGFNLAGGIGSIKSIVNKMITSGNIKKDYDNTVQNVLSGSIENLNSLKEEKVDYEVSSYKGYEDAIKDAITKRKDSIVIRVLNFDANVYNSDTIKKISQNMDPSFYCTGASYNAKYSGNIGIVNITFSYGVKDTGSDKVISVNSNTELYSKLSDVMYNYEENISFRLGQGVTFNQSIINQIIDNNPNICYTTAKGISASSKVFSNSAGRILKITLNYNYNVDTLRKMRDESEAAAKSIIAKIIKPSMGSLQKERAIHDYITNNARYADVDIVESHSEYGVLVKKVGVCESYAKAMYRLLNMAGVKNLFVTGTADGGAHAWNMVQIGSRWYHVDVTFDDPVGGRPSHRYFNITDSQISRDHTWDRSKYPAAK